MNRRSKCQLAMFVLLVQGVLLVQVGAEALAVEGDSDDSTKVGRLIEQLGADSYSTRVRAMDRLQRMGLEAFDELQLAQFDPDIEIEMAARFLVSSLLVSWSEETDPTEVRDTLHEYGAQDESERASRIEMLAEFPDRKGLTALVRLTRFETSMRLSRLAALAVMQQPMSDDPIVRRRNAEVITDVLDENDRQASEWLRVYSQDLARGDYSADRWRELIAVQRHEMDAATTQSATRPSILELVQICATRAIESGRREEALALARSNIDLIEPTTRHLIDACTWAIDHQLHPFVLDLREQFERMFDQQPVLLYGAAEAMKVVGDEAEADRLAELALQIRPLPVDEAAIEKMSPREIEEIAQAHREIGMSLQQRGLFHWAEREFRQIIKAIPIDTHPSSIVRNQLATMLGELERHDDVVEVLQPLIDRIENDDKFKQQLNSNFVPYNHFRSEVLYHGALAKLEKGDVDEARPMLEQAYALSESNVDILITMYRTDGDAKWKDQVQTKLTAAIRRADAEVQQAKVQALAMGRIGEPAIADYMNQYAWLVSNTEGDKQKALQWSLKSLELDADGAKYDTCGRCYFAVGDYDNAILMQKRAIKLMPHSPPLIRQLKEFEAARSPGSSN